MLDIELCCLTSEEFQDEEAPHHLVEEGVPHPATALIAPLVQVQHAVPPEDPGRDEEHQGDWEDHRRGCAVREGDDVDQANGAHLLTVTDALWPDFIHLCMRGLWLCAPNAPDNKECGYHSQGAAENKSKSFLKGSIRPHFWWCGSPFSHIAGHNK